jgi:hypothetical protein
VVWTIAAACGDKDAGPVGVDLERWELVVASCVRDVGVEGSSGELTLRANVTWVDVLFSGENATSITALIPTVALNFDAAERFVL